MKAYKILFIFALLTSSLFSIGEDVIKVEEIQNGQSFFLGNIAKGQSFSIYIDPIVKTGGKFGKGGRYDYAYATNLPEGWSSKESSLYGNPLEVVFKVSPEAKEGENEFLVFVKDEGEQEGLKMKWFVGKVNVVKDSSSFYSYVSRKSVGVRNPVNVFVEIENKVDFGNTYVIEVKAKDYYDSITTYVPAKSKEKYVFSLSFNKEGKEDIDVVVREKDNIYEREEFKHTIEVEESLFSEYSSIGEGIMLVPVSQALPYYLSYLVASLFS